MGISFANQGVIQPIEMQHAEDLLVFNRIHDLFNYVGLGHTVKTESEFTILNLANFRSNVDYISPLYKANFFSFFFVKEGDGKYSTDGVIFDTLPGSIYLNNPGHYKNFVFYGIKEVWLITLSESFLKEHVHGDIFDMFPFLLSEVLPPMVVSMEVFGEFECLYLQILREYNTDSPYRNKLIGHLVVVILLKIKEIFRKEYAPIREGSRGSEIVRKFKIMLEQHYRDLSNGRAEKVFRIQEYADAQHLHPNYFSNVIKSKTGKTIGTWIAEKTIMEAKSLLRNSALAIKEISSLLGFTESTHFSNYFKKHTNHSPASFRKSSNLPRPMDNAGKSFS
jgi:AraC family transcriptional activator of pobA